MSEETPTPSLVALLWAIAGRIFKREALLVLASTVVLMGTGASGVLYAQAQGQHAIDAGVDARINPLRDDLSQHKREAGAAIERLQVEVTALRSAATAKEERDAARFDLLYRTILTGQPSSRAERLAQPTPAPPVDGGEP